MAGWMKVLLGTEVGLGPGCVVLYGDPASPPKKGAHQPPIFGTCIVAKLSNRYNFHCMTASDSLFTVGVVFQGQAV